MSLPTFKGTPEQQSLAAEVFQIMSMQGAFFAADAPIRQTLANLADFLSRQRKRDHDTMVQEIDAALSENTQVFEREQHDDEIIYATSRMGAVQRSRDDDIHLLKDRLYEPENPLPIDDISVVVSTSRPALTTVEPVFISDYWQVQAGLTPAPEGSGEFSEEEAIQPQEAEPLTGPAPSYAPVAEDLEPVPTPEESVEEPPQTIETMPPFIIASTAEAPIAPQETAPAEQSEAMPPIPEEIIAEIASDAPTAEAAEAPVPQEQEEAAVSSELSEEHVETIDSAAAMTLPDGTTIDLSQPTERLLSLHFEALRAAFIDQVDRDPLRRIVHFGDLFYAENNLVSLGKNDLRRIRDYILEAGEPMLDTAIIADLYYHSQRQADYEGFRFSLNYRLSREKDFEFVGVPGACLWAVKGLPAIGTRRIKAGEMGQLTSYLVEGYDDSPTEQDVEDVRETGSLAHVLTFFEWAYGLMVFDAGLKALLPPPMLPEQRSAVLRFESPQHYASYLVEARYPTANRGGWLQGLDEFFREHLVAGALVTLERTDEPNVFTITYEETSGDAERILTLDEKKNKFTFADRDYFCAVDDNVFPSQRRFGRLKNLKSLPTSDRRKADMLLQHVFEVVGDQIGTRSEPVYQADVDTLYVAYNVLRPASSSYIKALLESNEAYVADESVPGIYSYAPEPEPQDETDEEEEGSVIKWDYEEDE
jgi:hypothetical protein